MEAKTGIEEKRVKSTVIRRRAKSEPEPVPVVLPAVEEKLVEIKQTVEAKGVAAVPASPPVVGAKAPLAQQAQAPTGQARAPEVRRSADMAVSPTVVEIAEKEKAKKVVARKKSKDELEMEMIERAGGLKKAAELMEVAPERLERVFRPEKSSKKRKILSRREFRKTEITTPKAIKRIIRIEGTVTVSDLAKRMSIKVGDVMKRIIDLGVVATINQAIDHDTAILVAHELGYEVENVAFAEASLIDKGKTEGGTGNVIRPAIVTVMGHVDHGKTSLLDAIRKTQVAVGEAGGITQHIGAYDVKSAKGSITFIDTPGHEAFTAMRARGAQVTDLVILVVAADDGIMPQTVEAINHAKAAKVPMIVAVNKIDKPGADLARVERGLMEQGLVSEKLGGDTIIVSVSAKTGQGVEDLLEMIAIQSEVLELKADPTQRAIGTIIEARLDKGRGPVATVVIQDGTLHQGDVVVAGTVFGKVRALVDALGNSLDEAGPSKPIEVLGLSGVPMAGDKLNAMESEDHARQIAEHREKKFRETRYQTPTAAVRLEDLYAKAAQGLVPEVRVVVKADVQGSIEALRESVTKLSTAQVRVSVIHTGVGAVNESDVMLATASQAIIIGFNVRPDAKGRELSERNRIQIRAYSIIYDVIDDMKKAMEGLLKPTYEEKYLGRVEVRQIFSISKIGTIAGSFVTDGKFLRTASVRLLRDGKVVHQGKMSSLKRFKEDAREVAFGLECGIGIENFNDIKPGDTIEAFQVEEIAGKL